MIKEKEAWERWPRCRLEHTVRNGVRNIAKMWGRVGLPLCARKHSERGERDREEVRELTRTTPRRSLDFIPRGDSRATGGLA